MSQSMGRQTPWTLSQMGWVSWRACCMPAVQPKDMSCLKHRSKCPWHRLALGATVTVPELPCLWCSSGAWQARPRSWGIQSKSLSTTRLSSAATALAPALGPVWQDWPLDLVTAPALMMLLVPDYYPAGGWM